MPPRKHKHKKLRFLDVACGMGSSLNVYKENSQAEIVAVDINPDVICQMKAKYPFASFFVADAHRLPFAKESFDRVSCTHVLEHVDRPLTVLKEAYRVLKPKGEIIITVPHPHYEKIVGLTYPIYHSRKFHQRIISQTLLLSLVEKAAFRPTKITTRRWFYALSLTFWSALGRILNRPLTHEGMMCIKGYSTDKVNPWLKIKEKIYHLPRRIADGLDSLPFVGFLNRLYPFETCVIAKKQK